MVENIKRLSFVSILGFPEPKIDVFTNSHFNNKYSIFVEV